MDIYSQASLIANSTTFVNVGNKKVKGILVSNLGGATGQANIHVYSATGGNTLQSVLGVPASSTFILPIKVTGASTSGALISVYGLY
jgi:hypothetical protein